MVVTWTYNAGTNTATAAGAGSTNFAALVAADTAGGWGKYTADATGTQIICAGKIVIGNGSTATVFSDTNKQVMFTNFTTANYGNLILVYGSSTFTIGNLDDATQKTTSRGCSIQKTDAYITNPIYALTGSTVNLYSSCIVDTSAVIDIMQCAGTGTFTIYNSTIMNCGLSNTGTWVLYNVQFQYSSSAYALNQFPTTASLTKVSVTGFSAVLYQSLGNLTLSDVVAAKNTYMVYYPDYTSKDMTFINATTDSWAFRFGTGTTGKVYRQYSFDLVVFNSAGTAISGATVTLKKADASNAFSVSTAADGTITQQNVSRGYYASATGNTLQDYGPFTLTVSKAGYMPYVHSGIVLDAPVDWRIYLRTQLSGDATEADVATGKTFYSNDADTKLTGTYTPTQLMEQRTKIRRVENPVDELLLMYTGMLTIENQKLRRNRIEPKPS